MIISHTHKFIFIHIPKCGGTSISKALIPFLGNDDVILGFNRPNFFNLFKTLPTYFTKKYFEKIDMNQGFRLFARTLVNQKEKNGILIDKHSPANDLKKFVGAEKWDNYYVFSVVRNPWDRIVSLYYWYHNSKWTDPDGLATKIRNLPSFDYFIKSELLQQLSCSDFLFDSGELIVDSVGKLENIDNFVKQVCSEIGLPEINIEKENVSQRKRNYKEYYNEITMKIISEKYEEDVKNFNYSY